MPLTPGSRLGSYEILSPLGAGGMGEVDRARDTKLNRDVVGNGSPALVMEFVDGQVLSGPLTVDEALLCLHYNDERRDRNSTRRPEIFSSSV